MADAPSTAPRSSGKRVLLAALVVFLVAVVPGLIVPSFFCRRSPPPLEELGIVPPFRLVDQTGAVITEEALRGHPTIVDFVFTRCDTVCPLTSLRMQTLQNNTAVKRGAGIKLLTFSVDPAHDTPAVLAAYAERYDANAQRWRFVTGDVAAMRTLVEGSFMQTMEDRGFTPSGAPDIVHGQHFLLVDGDLRIRGMYDSRDPKRLDALEYAARYLLRVGP